MGLDDLALGAGHLGGDPHLLNPTAPQGETAISEDIALEPPWRVIIHNDDVTPMDFVINVLVNIFRLPGEIATHVMLTAHVNGMAHVCTRPRREAQTLVNKAHFAARLEDYPLTFTLEPD